MLRAGRVAVFIAAGLVLLSVLGKSAPAQQADPATAAFDRGMAASKEGKYQAAIQEFDEAIRLKPAFSQAYNARGEAYTGLHQIHRGLADYDQAVALNPDFLEALDNRGRANRATGRPREALADFDRALKIKPDSDTALDGRGRAHYDLGEFARAIEDFDSAIKLKPDVAATFNHRALARHALRQDSKALDDIETALKLKPDFAEAVVDRGNLHRDLGRLDRAIKEYDLAIKMRPDYGIAYYNRGNAYRERREYQDALASYDQAIKFRPNYSPAYNNRAIVYRVLRQYQRAVADYSEAIRLNPGDPLALKNRAIMLKDMRRPDLAMADYSRARDAYDTQLRDNPNNTALKVERAAAAYNAERWKDAVADYSAVIALKDSEHFNDGVLAFFYLQRGRAAAAGGDNEAGLADVETALRLNRRIDQGQFRRASMRRAVGKYEEALEDYTEMAGDDDAIVWFNRAVTFFCLGKYREAENDVRRYLRQYRDEISSYAWIHIFRIKQGLPDDEKYSKLKSPFAKNDWISQIADLYRGRQTIEQTEAAMKASQADPQQKDNWPCSTRFFLGEYKLEHGDVAGAKADFAAITPSNCNYAEAAAAAAELKRLPAN